MRLRWSKYDEELCNFDNVDCLSVIARGLCGVCSVMCVCIQCVVDTHSGGIFVPLHVCRIPATTVRFCCLSFKCFTFTAITLSSASSFSCHKLFMLMNLLGLQVS